MSAKAHILRRVRQQLNVVEKDKDREKAVAAYLSNNDTGILPKRGEGHADQLLKNFVDHAKAANCDVSVLHHIDEIPREIAEFLRAQNLPQAIRHGRHPQLKALPWQTQPQLQTSIGPSQGNDPIGLSWADAGIAETGTLALYSGPENPTTLNFLPDTHIVVVHKADLVGHYEALWSKLAAKFGKAIMPRTVNLVTGPSRSGDIEQTILLGAHGPRSLKILVIDT